MTVRDYERLAAHHETCIYWAMIIVMTRRLARAAAQPQAAQIVLLVYRHSVPPASRP